MAARRRRSRRRRRNAWTAAAVAATARSGIDRRRRRRRRLYTVLYTYVRRATRAPSPACAHLRPSLFFDIACICIYIFTFSLYIYPQYIDIHNSTISLSLSMCTSHPHHTHHPHARTPSAGPFPPRCTDIPPSSSVVNKIGLRNQFGVTTAAAEGRPTSRRGGAKLQLYRGVATPTLDVYYVYLRSYIIYRHVYIFHTHRGFSTV